MARDKGGHERHEISKERLVRTRHLSTAAAAGLGPAGPHRRAFAVHGKVRGRGGGGGKKVRVPWRLEIEIGMKEGKVNTVVTMGSMESARNRGGTGQRSTDFVASRDAIFIFRPELFYSKLTPCLRQETPPGHVGRFKASPSCKETGEGERGGGNAMVPAWRQRRCAYNGPGAPTGGLAAGFAADSLARILSVAACRWPRAVRGLRGAASAGDPGFAGAAAAVLAAPPLQPCSLAASVSSLAILRRRNCTASMINHAIRGGRK